MLKDRLLQSSRQHDDHPITFPATSLGIFAVCGSKAMGSIAILLIGAWFTLAIENSTGVFCRHHCFAEHLSEGVRCLIEENDFP